MKILGIIDRRREIRESDGPISVRWSQHSAKPVRDGRILRLPGVLESGPVDAVSGRAAGGPCSLRRPQQRRIGSAMTPRLVINWH